MRLPASRPRAPTRRNGRTRWPAPSGSAPTTTGRDLDPAKDKVDLSEPFEKNRDAIGDRGYAGRYAILKDRVDKWFAKNGSKLGDALHRLRSHFDIKGVSASEHENVVGKSRGIEKGLKP